MLLLYPDYMADNYGQETYLTHVQAEDLKGAQRKAQAELVSAHAGYDQEDIQDPNDYAVLLVIKGHHNDIKEIN